MRRTAAILTSAAVLATLAACSTDTTSALYGCDIPSGDAVETVEGAFDSAEFPTPLVTDGLQFTTVEVAPVATESDDEDSDAESEDDAEPIDSTIEVGQVVDLAIGLYDGATGTELAELGSADDPATASLSDDVPVYVRMLACSEVGATTALTATVSDLYPDDEATAESFASNYGLEVTDTVVFVAETFANYIGKADGLNQLPQDGMPYVATAVDGTPGITLPDAEKPSELRVSTLKAGDHGVVEAGDDVLVHYSGWVWGDDGEPSSFDSSWESGTPVVFTLEEGSLIDGFLTALDGAEVGDQILAVIPPDQGYGDEGTSDGTIPGGATLVFVIDVLGVVE